MFEALSNYLDAKAEEKRVATRVQLEMYNSENNYGRYAYLIFYALNGVNSQGIVKPLDISEVTLPPNTRNARNYAFNVQFSNSESCPNGIETVIRSAIVRALAQAFGTDAKVVNQTHDIKVAGNNILVSSK